MVIITLQRDKCIGCNYCVEQAPEHWRMSKKDGKTVLLHSQEKKGFHVLRSADHHIFEANQRAANACPVKIIAVKKTDK
jgi:ferredoxin